MVTCALCKNAGVLWPLMNADVMPRSKAKPPPKGLSRNEKLYKNPLYGQGCIPIGVILDINGWKNNLSSFPANIFSKPKHEHNLTFYEPWHLIREAKRLNETLYNSVLKAVVFAESVKQDADRVWEGVDRPVCGVHVRLEPDWELHCKTKGLQMADETAIVNKMKTVTSTSSFLVFSGQSRRVERFVRLISGKGINIKSLRDHTHWPKLKHSNYTYSSAVAFETAKRCDDFIGCHGSTFSEIILLYKNLTSCYGNHNAAAAKTTDRPKPLTVAKVHHPRKTRKQKMDLLKKII